MHCVCTHSNSDDATDEDITVEDMVGTEINDNHNPSLGDIVEVYWVGDKKWFEGEVTDVEGNLFEVHYTDGEKLRHNSSCTKLRLKL